MNLGEINSRWCPPNWHQGWTNGGRCWKCYPYGYTYIDPVTTWDIDEVLAIVSRRLVFGETLVQAVNHLTMQGKLRPNTGDLFDKLGSRLPEHSYIGNLEAWSQSPEITSALFDLLNELMGN